VMAPGERGGWASHHQPAMVRQRTWAIASGEVRHHQLQGRVIISRAPVSYRADGVPGMAGYWSRLALLARTATTSISSGSLARPVAKAGRGVAPLFTIRLPARVASRPACAWTG